jgi:hypothetical protein
VAVGQSDYLTSSSMRSLSRLIVGPWDSLVNGDLNRLETRLVAGPIGQRSM